MERHKLNSNICVTAPPPPQLGKGNGTFGGVEYFTCEAKYGVLLAAKFVKKPKKGKGKGNCERGGGHSTASLSTFHLTVPLTPCDADGGRNCGVSER